MAGEIDILAVLLEQISAEPLVPGQGFSIPLPCRYNRQYRRAAVAAAGAGAPLSRCQVTAVFGGYEPK